MSVDSPPKDPRRVAAGKAAMRSRWGPQRVVRLDQLDADTRRLILALLAQRPTDAPEAPSAPEAA